jgi:RHS repeat-associated protein
VLVQALVGDAVGKQLPEHQHERGQRELQLPGQADAVGQHLQRQQHEQHRGNTDLWVPVGLHAVGVVVHEPGHGNDGGDSGLVYMQQRYYDPIAARFMSVDPITTDGKSAEHFNRYEYANNNPYHYVDPDGEAPPNRITQEGGGRIGSPESQAR